MQEQAANLVQEVGVFRLTGSAEQNADAVAYEPSLARSNDRPRKSIPRIPPARRETAISLTPASDGSSDWEEF